MQSLDSMLSYRFMSVYSILPLDTSPALSIILYFLVNVHVIKHSEIFHCVDKRSKRCHYYSAKRVTICENNPHMVCCNTVFKY